MQFPKFKRDLSVWPNPQVWRLEVHDANPDCPSGGLRFLDVAKCSFNCSRFKPRNFFSRVSIDRSHEWAHSRGFVRIRWELEKVDQTQFFFLVQCPTLNLLHFFRVSARSHDPLAELIQLWLLCWVGKFQFISLFSGSYRWFGLTWFFKNIYITMVSRRYSIIFFKEIIL